MKKFFAFVAFALFTFTYGCTQTPLAQDGTSANSAVITFEVLEHDYGTIEQGGNGVFDFVFKNTGNEPLVLSNVRSSCGCTIPEWPKDPIKKNKQAAIKVKYDTRRLGPFTKSITVYSNASNSPVVLQIKGKVETAASQE
ncbi:MAG: DUF1573 domain-containing protein [Bacteroidales bacterium]|nr:DUF1573 domain-containing protein [Bacteroidales bacterium]